MECMSLCNKTADCKSLAYEYGDSSSGTDITDDNGVCKLYSTCISFCKNTGKCAAGSNTHVIVSFALFFIVLFGFIFFTVKKMTPYTISSGVIMFGILGWAIYELLTFLKNQSTGSGGTR
jgi:hypothetical protein